MKKLSLIAAALLVAFSASAQGYVENCPESQPRTSIRPTSTVLLYPGGQAAGKGIVENGVQVTNPAMEDNGLRGPEVCPANGNRGNIGDDARMDIYLPAHGNGLMIIIAPGGGYAFVSSFNEGAYAAKWLTDRGVAAVVLKYRMPNGHHTVPLDDMQNAFRYCRHHAAEWGISKIGVMGASAGGHLAACASVMSQDALLRPDFSVLIYPRITLLSNQYSSTRNNLLKSEKEWAGQESEYEQCLEYWSPESHVSTATPPTFIVLSSDDNTVPPTNCLQYYTRLVQCKVPVEMHVFPCGGHGWGFSAEKYVGEGKDRFEPCRQEFETALHRWLDSQLY